ncbi:hypothetical protein EDB85DRAFT_2277723, partial [Lactarius pseudohatsudake]
MAAASLDINLKEELSFVERAIPARPDPMTALLSTMPGFPPAHTFNTSATNRQSIAFDSCLRIPPIPSATQATLSPRSSDNAPNSRPPATPRILTTDFMSFDITAQSKKSLRRTSLDDRPFHRHTATT